jgi:hypothetical protein
MKRFALDMGVLLFMFLFEVWNVKMAKRRGWIFLHLNTITKTLRPKDFNTAIILNAIYMGIILIVAIMVIYAFVSKHN